MAWAQANPEKLHQMATQKDPHGRPSTVEDFMQEDFWWAPLPPEPEIPVHLKVVENE